MGEKHIYPLINFENAYKGFSRTLVIETSKPLETFEKNRLFTVDLQKNTRYWT